MKNKPPTWLTIKYKEDAFDVKLSISEVNIASLLSLEVKKEFHEIIVNKGTHHAL